jgi:hypothetical protein
VWVLVCKLRILLWLLRRPPQPRLRLRLLNLKLHLLQLFQLILPALILTRQRRFGQMLAVVLLVIGSRHPPVLLVMVIRRR